MSKKVFIEGNDYNSRAYFGWQDKGSALYGLKVGYKNSADSLVRAALRKGKRGDIYTLDTYIFPIIFLYRHSIEVSLKYVYNRFRGKIQDGDHDLEILWDKVCKDVITEIKSPTFLNQIKAQKKNFRIYKIADKDIIEMTALIKELNGVDKKADVWRYLMNKKGNLYFTSWNYIDYKNLRKTLNYMFEFLDFLYNIIDDYLTGDPL